MELWAPRRAGRISYACTELIHTIRRCGLTSGLQLCLDAGDANSYSSGQSWLDTSGNGYDFFRGATGSSEASDPTFNGTAGRRSSGEYGSFDGGDYFRYDSANETWMNSLHQDNAKFTLVAWVYFPEITDVGVICGDTRRASVPGCAWWVHTNETQGFQVLTTGALVLEHFSTTVMAINTWHFVAISLDEAVGANGACHVTDSTTEYFTSTYTSPSSSAADKTLEIGAFGNAVDPVPNTFRIGMFAAWSGEALTQSQLLALYQHTRGRYGV